jgi:hypothetical protein
MYASSGFRHRLLHELEQAAVRVRHGQAHQLRRMPQALQVPIEQKRLVSIRA